MPGKLASPLLWHRNGAAPEISSIDAWNAYTGQNEEAAQEWGWLNAVHPDDRENTWTAVTKAALAHTTSTFYCKIRHITETYQHFRILTAPCFNQLRKIQSWLFFFINEPIEPPEVTEHWESLAIYNTVIQQSKSGVLSLSLDGKIIQVNEHFCNSTGYTEQELLSQTLWQLSTDEYIDKQLQCMQRRLISGQAQPPFRTRYQRKDGSDLWVRLVEFLMYKPSGEPVYFFYLVEDITAMTDAEVEREELLARIQDAHMETLAHAHRLEAIVESISDGIMVSDTNGRIVHSNSAVNRILHLDNQPEFLRLSFRERTSLIQAFDEKGRRLLPGEWPLAHLLRGESLQDIGLVGDLREILPDGHEIYVNHTGSCLRNEHNQITGAVLVIRDVTERHRMEQNVRKSFGTLLALAEELVHIPKKQREQLIEELSFPQVSVRAAGEYLTEMTCQMMEYQVVSLVLLNPDTEEIYPIAMAGGPPEDRAFRVQQLQGHHISDYLDPTIIARLRTNKVAFNAFVRYIGDALPYEMLIAPMIMDNQLVGVLGVGKQGAHVEYNQEEIGLVKAVAKLILLVMERERLQTEWIESHSSELALLEANKRFDEFLSMASHELRTPLTGIKGNVQLALRRLAKLKSSCTSEMTAFIKQIDSIQDYLVNAEHRVNVQNRMIGDFLDVSRIQADKLELVMAPCNLITIVSEAVEDQRYSSPNRTITLTLPSADEIMVTGDADRLGQVIHNYLTNALKYSPADRPVKVALDLEVLDNAVRVSVCDEGPGLTPEEQKRVWERFYRVEGIHAQGTSSAGLGLGLYICRRIIEMHGGQLGLESTPGAGSIFWFTIPLAQLTFNSPTYSSFVQSKPISGNLEQNCR